MAETKSHEREYVIPLRRVWQGYPEYERSKRAIKGIKKFVAKHMKIVDRDLDKVKLDVYFNNEVWFRGRTSPPAKIKVKVTKVGSLVHVNFVQDPDYVKFLKVKHARFTKKADKKVESKHAEKAEEKTAEQVQDEKEKEKAVEQQNITQAEQQVKADKHSTKASKHTHPQRMALKK